jgi:hypothetical protein
VNLQAVIDLGSQPLANNLLSASDLRKREPRFLLEMVVGMDCWLMQILHVIPPVDLFSDYFFLLALLFSGFVARKKRNGDSVDRSLVAERVFWNFGYFLVDSKTG